ncbi:hypothetical protein Tco_0991798 [Tanacetum coccineum]|uniref:Uncharacterized protein n=1 Tax=Tanacetum coccineum TaxID=301880 RepID=A0ABQ5F0L5_9ASTR
MGSKPVHIKVFIDKKKKKVMFAEAEEDFVEILFSFLTLPLGTIARISSKHGWWRFVGGVFVGVLLGLGVGECGVGWWGVGVGVGGAGVGEGRWCVWLVKGVMGGVKKIKIVRGRGGEGDVGGCLGGGAWVAGVGFGDWA